MKLVLIVEDEYGNAEILQLLLEAEGYRVAVATNGKQALEILRNGEKPSLVLSDFMMPVMNGGELGVAIRRDPAFSQMPFIFMSGTSEDVVRRAFDDYDALLAKPYELDTLLAIVKRFATDGRLPRPPGDQVEESMRQLLKGIRVPPGD
ncbi:MAG: response regulator [Pseudomonadota bacterium]